MQHQDLHSFIMDKVDDMKAENIVSLDVRGKSPLTDFLIICTGTSRRHVASIANNVAMEAKKTGIAPYGMDGEKEGEWVVLDMGDVMVHVMQEEHRDLYQLEKLWS
ncbi:ribosome silencing factor [Aliivibrio kagoshimensis]